MYLVCAVGVLMTKFKILSFEILSYCRGCPFHCWGKHHFGLWYIKNYTLIYQHGIAGWFARTLCWLDNNWNPVHVQNPPKFVFGLFRREAWGILHLIAPRMQRWCNFILKPCFVVLRSEIPSGMCAKLRTVTASNNRDHASQSLLLLLARSTHTYFCSSRTSRSWWITQSTQHHRRGCNSRLLPLFE